MKKYIALLLAITLIASLFIFGAEATNYGAGRTCIDYVHLCDENKTKVADFGMTARNLGDINSYVLGKNAKYIHVQGWYSDDSPIADMGYSVNGDEPVWGFGQYDENLVAVKDQTQHEYPYRFYVYVPITVGEDISIEICYKLENGETGVVPGNTTADDMTITYSNTEGSGRYITTSFTSIKFVGDDIYPTDATIEITDAANKGKDWVGVILASVDINDVKKSDLLGWWAYVSGDNMNFDAKTFKQSGAYELDPDDYYICLFEDDGYKVLDYKKFTVNGSADDWMYFDGKGIINGVNQDAEDFGDITSDAGDATEMRFFGWFASDSAIESIGYRYADGTEAFVVGKERTDAASARSTIFAMGFDINVPIKNDGQQELDFVVKFADGTEEIYQTFYYYCSRYGETKAPTATPTSTPIPTDTPVATDTPKPTETPEVKATEEPAEETAEPAEKKGCGGVITCGMAIITLAGVCLFLKKNN